jgi:hypothetical protein
MAVYLNDGLQLHKVWRTDTGYLNARSTKSNFVISRRHDVISAQRYAPDPIPTQRKSPAYYNQGLSPM